jgi:DnaJ-class molecular chaperone
VKDAALPKVTRIDLRGDYYGLLGIPENASGREIRSDESGAAHRFNAVSEAYQVLRDPDQRACYDHHHQPKGTVDRPHDSPERPPHGGYPHGSLLGADRFAPRARRCQGPDPGTDVDAVLELSPQEAALAATTGVTLSDTHGNTIVLPAGTRPGQRICIAGAGRRGRPPGDLVLIVRIASADLT